MFSHGFALSFLLCKRLSLLERFFLGGGGDVAMMHFFPDVSDFFSFLDLGSFGYDHNEV